MTDIRAFRLFMLVQWGHDPEHIMNVMSPGYRTFIFACVDAWALEQSASISNMSRPRSQNSQGLNDRPPLSIQSNREPAKTRR